MRPAIDDPEAVTPSGIPYRPKGQARALARAATCRGFTRAVPSVTRACAVLLATARRGGLGTAPTLTLTVLLQRLPPRRWHELPVLRLSNQRIADAVGCASRTVQRHLRRLHEHGVIAISWGPGNTRLPHRQDGSTAHEPVGIDLRPALVFAGEMADLLRADAAALRTFHAERDAASTSILWTRAALDADKALHPATLAGHHARLAEFRQHLRAATHSAHRPAATAMSIADATVLVRNLGASARALRFEPKQAAATGGGEDAAVDSSPSTSSEHDNRGDQKTESTSVEIIVRTIQGPHTAPAARPAGEDGLDDPAEPLLYGRWRRAYDGSAPLSSGDLVELEIAARQRASRMGVSAALLAAATARHGTGLTIGAVLHVSALSEQAGIRSRGGLLASLLRREAGQLAPATFHRRLPTRMDLSEAEALGVAGQAAPSHQPAWVVRRWQATRQRRAEPIHDPRRCLAAFAAKLEREQGRPRWAS